MSHQLLKGFEVTAALIIAATTHFYFAYGPIASVLLGLTAFVLVPLLAVCWFHVRPLSRLH
jgi:hypothetical protein